MSSCKFRSSYSYIKTCSHITISATCHAHTHTHHTAVIFSQLPFEHWPKPLMCFFVRVFVRTRMYHLVYMWGFHELGIQFSTRMTGACAFIPPNKKGERFNKRRLRFALINYWENHRPGDLPILIIKYPIKTSSMVGSCCFYTPMFVGLITTNSKYLDG